MKRFQVADLMKGIAVLLMIQVHIIELFATSFITESEAGHVLLFLGGPFVAPVFVVFMGYFIALVNKPTSVMVLRGVKVFAGGILLNCALNLNLLISVAKGTLDVDVLSYIFGVDILLFAGLAIIAITLLKKLLDLHFIVTTSVSLIIALSAIPMLNFTVENTFLSYLLSFVYGCLNWSYFPLFPWLSYALLGYAAFQFQQKVDLKIFDKPILRIGLSIILVGFMIVTIKYAISISSALNDYYHHGLLFFVWTAVFLCFYRFFLVEIERYFSTSHILKYVKWLGENVTLIYFIQWIIIGNIATSIYKTVSSPAVLAASYIGVLIISSVLAFLYKKYSAKRHTS